MKGFKYQIVLKVLLSKQKQNRYTKFSTVYFNSTEKTVIIQINMVLINLFNKFCVE